MFYTWHRFRLNCIKLYVSVVVCDAPREISRNAATISVIKLWRSGGFSGTVMLCCRQDGIYYFICDAWGD